MRQSGPVVLVGTCSTCDRVFHRGEEAEWQRHVGPCAREHLPELMAAREEHRKRMEIFEPWDPEVDAHLRGVGERMRGEGRMVMKPSERAGF